MSILTKPTPAPISIALGARTVSVVLGALLVAAITLQLMNIQGFMSAIASFWLPGGQITVYVLTLLIINLEILAIPFLMSFSLSPAMRMFSMISGWIVSIKWLSMSLWILLSTNAVTNVGIFGSIQPIEATVQLSVTLGVVVILIAWVSWAMWPLRRPYALPSDV